MRVLVTGGAGYIGSLVVEELVNRGHHPVVLDTLYWGDDSLRTLKNDITLVVGDCRSSKDVIYALEGAEAVIHLAGLVGEPACKINYKAHHTINVGSTRNVVQCCTDRNLELISNFVFLSSCSVYGNVKGLYEEVTEETPTSPLSWYADGKLQSEEIILRKADEVAHFRPLILRLTTIFGWSLRPRLDLVSNMFAYRALKEGKLTIWGDGLQYRSLIHAKDVAMAAVLALESSNFKRHHRIFHVGEETNNKTINEIASIVQSFLPETEIEHRQGQSTDRRDYRINCQRFKNVFNWNASFSVSDGIREVIDNIKESDLDWDSYKYVNDRFDYI